MSCQQMSKTGVLHNREMPTAPQYIVFVFLCSPYVSTAICKVTFLQFDRGVVAHSY